MREKNCPKIHFDLSTLLYFILRILRFRTKASNSPLSVSVSVAKNNFIYYNLYSIQNRTPQLPPPCATGSRFGVLAIFKLQRNERGPIQPVFVDRVAFKVVTRSRVVFFAFHFFVGGVRSLLMRPNGIARGCAFNPMSRRGASERSAFKNELSCTTTQIVLVFFFTYLFIYVLSIDRCYGPR